MSGGGWTFAYQQLHRQGYILPGSGGPFLQTSVACCRLKSSFRSNGRHPVSSSGRGLKGTFTARIETQTAYLIFAAVITRDTSHWAETFDF